MSNILSIASIGECMIELSGSGGDAWRLGYAGDTFNTLWALHALLGDTAKVDYVSAFGDDPFSRQQIDFMQRAGIGIGSSPVIPGARPGLYAITLDGAERSFTYWRNDAAAKRLADDRTALSTSLAGRSLIYFSGITLAILDSATRWNLIDAIEKARANGALVAFDPNYRPRLWTDRELAKSAISNALAATDIALPTFPDEQTLFGDASSDATVARLRASGVREIVVKDGERPCLIHSGADDKATTDTIAAENVMAVDTTGAGDSFNGAYLAARLLGDDPIQAARRAHKVAGAVVQVRGALAPFETLRAAFAA